MIQALTEIEMLAAELVDFFESPQSRGFYLSTINLLGAGLVRQAWAEVRMRMKEPNTEEIKDPARYFTSVLVNWLKERDLYKSADESVPERVLTQSAFDIIQGGLVDEKNIENGPLQNLETPFSPDLIQWLHHIGPEYFTVKNEIAQSDRVDRTLVPIGGRLYEVPMLRGRLTKDGKERGIPNAEHMRIVGAVERIWADKHGPHGQEGRLCVVRASVPEITQYMGIGLSNKEYHRITDKVHDLGSTGYLYLLEENPELKAKGLKEMSFKFFGDVTSIKVDRTTYFQITFSRLYSAALLSRDKILVSRPNDLLRIESGISWKLYLYLYPFLIKKGEHSIELKNLIKVLDLRIAGWHQYKSTRKREFEKSLKDINGRKAHDGRVFSLRIEQGLNDKDYLLVARLIDAEEGSHGNV